MKGTTILKSLDQLSPELVGANAPPEEPRKTQQTPQRIQEIPPVPQPRSFPVSAAIRGYERWGINE